LYAAGEGASCYRGVTRGLYGKNCFGKAGQLITTQPQFNGENNFEGVMEKNEILVDNNYIKGIIYQI